MTKGDVPVDVVARSLLANERLFQESLRLLAELVPGLHVQKVRIRVGHVTNTSSLRQALIAAVVLTFQQNLQRQVPRLVEMLSGKDVPEDFNTLVTVLVMIVAITVVDTTIERMIPGRSLAKLERAKERKLEELASLAELPK